MSAEDRTVPASQVEDGKVNGKISLPMPTSVGGLAPAKVSRLDTKEIDDLGKNVTVQIEVESDDGQGSESESNGSEGALTVEEVTALTEIKIIQKEIDNSNAECLNEIEKVEQKFMAIKQPMIELRDKQIEKINYFWLKTFLKHSKLYALIREEEKPALTYLSKVEVHEFPPNLGIGYKMRFSFDANPYFTNQMFEKVFAHEEYDELVQKSVIDWKEGMNFMDGLKGKSFFHWLIDAPDPDSEDSYEIAEAIRQDIWLNPAHYFCKNCVDDDEFEEDEEDFGFSEEEAEEEEDDREMEVFDEEDDIEPTE